MRPSPHHDHIAQPNNRNITKIKWAIVLTTVFMLAEVIGGWLVNSVALVADGVHMFSDSIALILAFTGFYIAQKPPTATMTYGYQRVQVLTAFLNALSLIVISLGILVFAIYRITHPAPILSTPMLWIAILGLVINLIVFAMMHSGDQQNMNMRGATLHFMGDTLNSVAVIIGALIISWTGYTLIDPIISVLISIVIAYTSFPLLKQSSRILLEGVPEGYDVDKIQNSVQQRFPELQNIHHTHLWAIADDQVLMTIHAHVSPKCFCNDLMLNLKTYLKKEYNIHHVTLQFEKAE